MSSRSQSFFVYFLLIVAIGAMLYLGYRTNKPPDEMSLSHLAVAIQQGSVKSINIEETTLQVILTDGTKAEAYKEPNTNVLEYLIALNTSPEKLQAVTWEVKKPSLWSQIVGSGALNIVPILVVAVVLWFIFRQAQGSNNQAMQLGKSRARMFSGEHPTVTFKNVGGVDNAIEDLKEVVDFLREPQKFIQLGARPPKGVLFVGPTGTGKTLLAKAVTSEAGVPFFSISASEFVEMFVGIGASRVRDLFDQAKRHSPCIVFIDEIDAVGAARRFGDQSGGGSDERNQTLNQILMEMDGIDSDDLIITLAATNRPDVLDAALLRPGRFDRRIILDHPDEKGREQIFKVHVRGKPLEPSVDLQKLAMLTPGFSGAEIEKMVNEAAILAARRNRKSIGQTELEDAVKVTADAVELHRKASEEENTE